LLKLRSAVQLEQELAQSPVQCNPQVDFILLAKLLTYQAAEQQNLVSCQVRSPRAIIRLMHGLEMGV
jgi:hypothetical protein